MGIQIKGSNDTISAADGSLVLEGVSLTFDNENITGISTMATAVVTSGDLTVGVSTLFVDNSTGRIGVGTAVPVGKHLTVGPLQEPGTDRSALAVKTVANSLANGEAAIHIEEASGTEGYFLGVDSSGGLSFTNSGTSYQTLYLGDNDNVGIGTDNPQVKLTVSSDSPAVCDIHHIDGGTGDEARIILGALHANPPSNRGAGIAALNNGGGHDLLIKCSASHAAGPTEKVRVKSSGLVGIGTDTSASSCKLQLVEPDSTEVFMQVANQTTGYDGNSGLLIGYNGSEVAKFMNMENTAMDIGTNGNPRIAIANDGHIVFSNSIALNGETAAANRLEDYEEGTWTGGIQDFSATYTSQNGYYTKVGNLVTATVMMAGSGSPGSGNMKLTSLPFTCQNGTNYRAVASFFCWTGFVTGGLQIVGSMSNNTNYVNILGNNNNGNATHINRSALNSGGWEFQLTISYHV